MKQTEKIMNLQSEISRLKSENEKLLASFIRYLGGFTYEELAEARFAEMREKDIGKLWPSKQYAHMMEVISGCERCRGEAGDNCIYVPPKSK